MINRGNRAGRAAGAQSWTSIPLSRALCWLHYEGSKILSQSHPVTLHANTPFLTVNI